MIFKGMVIHLRGILIPSGMDIPLSKALDASSRIQMENGNGFCFIGGGRLICVQICPFGFAAP